MKKFSKAFTLVELIVVITILAILGTIAFISLQGYSKEARDSKRLTDVRNLVGKISIENTKGTSYSDLITKINPINLIIDGTGATSNIGVANFEKLKEQESNFKDPLNEKQDYPIAYAIGGTGSGAYAFVQAATINEVKREAVLVGRYYQMQPGDAPSLFKSGALEITDGGNILPYNPDNGGSIVGGGDGEGENLYNCAPEPYENDNINYVIGKPSVEGQEWVKGTSGACYYSCKSGWEGDDCTVPKLGTFNNPAKNCLEILTTYSDSEDGEYWIKQSSSDDSPVKTLCDMTHGGYTLMWTYSENTARNIYPGTTGSTTSMSINRTNLRFGLDVPTNLALTEDSSINYNDYRLSKATMNNIKDDGVSQYRVRIAYNPTNINDAWGNENYFAVEPKTIQYDYIATSGGGNATSGNQISTIGKLFNLSFRKNENSTASYFGPLTNSYNIGQYYGNNSYIEHWDFGNVGGGVAGFGTGTTSYLDTTITRQNGTIENTQISVRYFNNVFGWFGEKEINHHFGKCGENSDDYSFETKFCETKDLYPHSFNNGEGRYLQWFVK